MMKSMTVYADVVDGKVESVQRSGSLDDQERREVLNQMVAAENARQIVMRPEVVSLVHNLKGKFEVLEEYAECSMTRLVASDALTLIEYFLRKELKP